MSARPSLFFDASEVRDTGRGRWRITIPALTSIGSEFLTDTEGPCPWCHGGGNTRFRFTDMDGNGSCFCSHCARDLGDGFAVIMRDTGKEFAEVLSMVANHLGIEPSKRAGKNKANPNDSLTLLPWDEGHEMIARVWAIWRPGVTLEAVKAVGGRFAKYGSFTVIALPVWGPQLDAAPPVGWAMFNSSGADLPMYTKDKSGKYKIDRWEKVKLSPGSGPGLLGDPARIRTASRFVKVEGCSDLLAVLSLADLPADYCPVTNANGAGEIPKQSQLDLIAGPVDARRNEVLVVHDTDDAGQLGALGRVDEKGKQRPGWATAIAAMAPTKNVVLPFSPGESGKDLRDWLAPGRTFVDLQALAASAPVLTAVTPESQPVEATSAEQLVIEEDDDPHYLARTNLEQFNRRYGGVLKFWREQFYSWRPDRGCFKPIAKEEMRGKLTAAIKTEFDRQWSEQYERYREWQKSDSYDPESDKGPPKAHKVQPHLVRAVYEATASLCRASSATELMTWVENGVCERRPYIALKNGLLHVENMMADCEELADCLSDLSSDWFSMIRLPYKFDADADCPRWESVLNQNLEGDAGRIKTLQEWAGYLLLPDTGEAKFLALQGQGANGKSVYMAGVQAMLGAENCSHIGLERLSGAEFDVAETIGKLVNVCADVGEVDKVAEGYLKHLTSGEPFTYKRKGICGLTALPTARLMMAFNTRPRFSDRTDGIWRRLIYVPFNTTIPVEQRIKHMDKAWWWEQSGELPGIFNWALEGLYRLRKQGWFTISKVSADAADDYRNESCPERRFIHEHLEPRESGQIKVQTVYDFYRLWCESGGYKPMNDGNFGKELKVIFPKLEKKRFGKNKKNRGPYFYLGIDFSVDEICGKQIPEEIPSDFD